MGSNECGNYYLYFFPAKDYLEYFSSREKYHLIYDLFLASFSRKIFYFIKSAL